MTSSISGLGSGLDINSIVDQLMQLERKPQQRVIAQRDDVQARLDALGKVRSSFRFLNTAATMLDRASLWKAFTSATSDDTIATATSAANATTGSLTFTVDRLATTAALRSTNTIASPNTVIASGNLLIAKGGTALGLSSLASDASLPVGKYDIRVTQSSAAASRTATSALDATTVITAGDNDTITANINGSATTITIAAGSYTRSGLASAITAAAGNALTASVSATTQRLTLKTLAEGSAASIEITGGTALGDLGLDVDASAAIGADGIVKVGDTETTISSISAGGTASLAAETGSVTATFSGGLRVGVLSARNVSLGTGTLSAVVNAINGANNGVTAAAIKVGTDAYRLQVTSTSAGSSGRLNLDTAVFAGMGGLSTVSQGNDAKITIGDGEGAYSVESASNTVSNVLPGVTINLKKQSTDPVTISIARDASALAGKVNGLVNAANSVISQINDLSKYDATSKKGGPLTGVATMRALVASVTQAVATAVNGNSLGAGNQAGISVNRDGTIAFNQQKFLDAYNADPDTVSDLFVRRASTDNAAVTFSGASASTRSGSYAVQVTTPATRAAVTGSALGSGTITDAETIDVKVGSTSATYAATAGESLTSIADGLNAAIAASGLALSASVSSGQLVVRATAYGASGSFSVRSNATGTGQTGVASADNSWEAHNGVDIAGTIDGKTAKGSGAVLTVPTTDSKIPGLAVTVTGTSSGSYGTVTYAPGIAARLALAVIGATDAKVGSITAAEQGSQASVQRYNKDIDDWDRRLADRQARLKAQYATLDTTLGQLRNQSGWLSAQIAGLG